MLGGGCKFGGSCTWPGERCYWLGLELGMERTRGRNRRNADLVESMELGDGREVGGEGGKQLRMTPRSGSRVDGRG